MTIQQSFGFSTNRWRARWQAFLHPFNGEKERLLHARWENLPAELKTSNQISGRRLTHCGFTTGASYCSFRCTHCYLPKNANQVPMPSLAQMKEQIDANRRLQGPDGGLQITGGDVADAYFKSGRQDELVEIVRHAVAVGLVPMLMTHGQTLIEHPEFLEKLVVEGGLRQVAIHIDMTQVGRHGYPICRINGEADLHTVRQAFTKLAINLRQKTSLRLELAHNCTVTGKNIEGLPEIIRWFLAEPERTRIWRYLSFQPEADTGRTILSARQVTPKLVWAKICEGVGMNLEEHAFIVGHPDCNRYATLIVADSSGRVLPLVPADGKSRALFAKILAKLGGLSTITDDDGTLPYRIAGALSRNPGLATRTLAQVASLVSSRVLPFESVRALVSGQFHTVNIGMHNFMDAARVANAPNDPVTRARLEACVFKGAAKNHVTGAWEAVPMCEMNQHRWSELYSERLGDPTLVPAVGRSELGINAPG